MAALHEVRAIIRCHRPHAKPDLENLKTGEVKFWRYLSSGFSERSTDNKSIITGCKKLGDDLKPFRKIELPKCRRDKKWMKNDQASGEALSKFWASVRSHQRGSLESLGISEEDIKYVLYSLRCYRPLEAES